MSKAVVVIDIQNDYFPGGAFPLHKQVEAGEKAAKVIADARAKSIPVIFIQHISANPEAIPFFLPDTKGAEIADVVKPLENEVVIKKFYPNSFVETTLQEKLTELKITDLVLIGSMSHMCVQATTRAAADLKYKCVVVEDACACPAQEFNGVTVTPEQVHAVSMSSLAFGYATIVNAEKYLE